MKVWRISRAQHARTSADAFDGAGASFAGGRRISAGFRLAYSSTSPYLAALEYLANFVDRAHASVDLMLASADIPDAHVIDATPNVPLDWHQVPAPPSCAAFGDSWILARTSLALVVPSVVLLPPAATADRNVLVNPLHSDAHAMRFGPVQSVRLDTRLFE